MISGGYGGGTFATSRDFIESFLEQFLSPSSRIWTELEGGTLPALDAITQVYGFFDQPEIKLLYQDNLLAYMLSLGPLFLMSSRSSAMSGTSSLSGFLGAMEWVSNQIRNFLHCKIVYFDFSKTSYFKSLGKRKVRAYVSTLLGTPIEGENVTFGTSHQNSSIESPVTVPTNSDGYAEVKFDGTGLRAGDATTIKAEITVGGKKSYAYAELYTRDNSNISLEDILNETAVFIWDDDITIKGRTKRSDSLDIQKKFDFVQYMLNYVLDVSASVDGIFYNETERAIASLRMKYPEVQANNSPSTFTSVFKELMEAYDIPENEWMNWRNKIIDRGLLVGKELMELPSGEKDGLYELYFNPLSFYYDITPHDTLKLNSERKLKPEENGIYNCLGGIKVKAESDLSVFKEDYLIDGYQWQASNGAFFKNYYVNSDVQPNHSLYKIFWKGLPKIPYEATITLRVDYRRKNFPLISHSFTVDKILGTRELSRQDPILQGDDVKMLQDLLNWLGWENFKETHKKRIDGVFEDTTQTAFRKFVNQNYWGNKPVTVNSEILDILNKHYDDYRNALDDFHWANGIGADPVFDTIARVISGEVSEQFVDSIEKWVEEADNEVPTILPSYAELNMNPQQRGNNDYPQGDDNYPQPGDNSFRWLLIKIIEKETGYIHWRNWRVTFGLAGDLGFVQMMCGNSCRYANESGTVPAEINLYKPDDNIMGMAHHMRDIIQWAYGRDPKYPNREHACMVPETEFPPESKVYYTDDLGDLIGKVGAVYNRGFKSVYKEFPWDAIVSDPEWFVENGWLTRSEASGIEYGTAIKRLLGIP